jgi:hypothetical protein
MNKVCILLTFVKEIDNYSNLLNLFDKKNLILCLSDFDTRNLIVMKKFCDDRDIKYITLSEVFKKKLKFKILITQNFDLRCLNKFSIIHYLKFIFNKFFFKKKLYAKPIVKLNIKNICDKSFKFPKGLDASNFLSKKKLYQQFDEIFCHSTYEKNELKKIGFTNVSIIGFPRYNLDTKSNVKDITKQFKIKPYDKVLFWLPSRLDKANSTSSNIYLWINVLKKFTKKYKFICRPHPDLVSKELISDLKKNNFLIDCNEQRKLSDIYNISNFVFCDYGETIFSSLFFKKKVILLNYLNNINDRFHNQVYLDVKIRDFCPNFNLDDNDNVNSSIEKLISNEKDWKIFENKRSSFFKEIFPTGNQKTYNQLFLDTVNRYL